MFIVKLFEASKRKCQSQIPSPVSQIQLLPLYHRGKKSLSQRHTRRSSGSPSAPSTPPSLRAQKTARASGCRNRDTGTGSNSHIPARLKSSSRGHAVRDSQTRTNAKLPRRRI